MIIIPNILDNKQIDELTHAMLGAKFVDGKATAGRSAALVKNNTQVASDDEMLPEMQQLVAQALTQNETFQAYTRPKAIIDVLFSRYDVGQEYGTHVDNAMMKNNRVDLAFTILLSDGFKGGELIIEQGRTIDSEVCKPGDVVVYPATQLHQVMLVRAGYRLAAIGWIESFIRSHEHRETLFDLELIRAAMFEKDGKTREFDLLSKSTMNLTRMWSGL